MRRTAIRFAVALLGLLFVAAGAHVRVCAQEGANRSSLRTWTSTSGHTTKATFDSFDGERVRLKKEDGTFVRLEIDKLSDADQQYVTAQPNGRGHPEDGASGKSPGDIGETSEFLIKCQRLAGEIAKNYQGRGVGGKAKIAVVEFSDLNGDVTDFGRLLSEELITKLSTTGNYTVVERFLLNKAVAEHKLVWQGVVDPKSAKELGRILGVDAIVSGTVAPLGDSVRVNARVISTETGEVLSSAAVSVANDDSIDMTPGKGPRPRSQGATAPQHGKGQPVRFPFREDFSSFEDDATTDWGAAGKVRTGADGRKWLVPVGLGQKPVGIDVNLPDSASIELDYDAVKLESKDRGAKVLSGISLVDETGAKYRIEWEIDVGGRDLFLRLPGGAQCQYYGSSCTRNTLAIRKTGDQIKLYLVGECSSFQHEVSGNLSDFKKFVRLEVDLYRGKDAQISFTNFKIEKLAAASEAKPHAPKRRR